MIFTHSSNSSVNQRAPRLSYGMVISTGILLSEHTFANALAVLPAEATTITLSLSSGSLAHTEYASVSLNEQVFMKAPFSGQYPENVIYRFSKPRCSASFSDLYVTGAQDPARVRLTGSHSAYL